MATDSNREDRVHRRAARAARRAARHDERTRRRLGLRASMEQHRAFMAEFEASGNRIKKMKHPLAQVIRKNQRNGDIVEAVRKYFKGLMGADSGPPEEQST